MSSPADASLLRQNIALKGRNYFYPEVSDQEWNDWHWQYRNRVKTLDQLANFLPFPKSELSQLRLVKEELHVGIPPYYLSLIDPYDIEDPIRKQAVPSSLEFLYHSVGKDDPLEEDMDSPVPGLVHRYPDRVLLISTSMCPMYCRHCTRRREWEIGEKPRTRSEIDVAIDHIAATPQIRDVILSGGDPFTLGESTIDYILKRLRKISHVEMIRIGTRFPVVLPQRINQELCNTLEKYAPIWINTHFNHPREISKESANACKSLLKAGMVLNNQTVLMRGVNDSVEIIKDLCHKLMAIGVRPYYLFQCDPVKGVEHLRTSIWAGMDIMEKMRGNTSGLCIPTYIVDLPGGGGKIPIMPNYILSISDEEVTFRNFEGLVFHYENPRQPNKKRKSKGHAPSLPFEEDIHLQSRLERRLTLHNANRVDI